MTREDDESFPDEGDVRLPDWILSGVQLLWDYSGFLALLIIGAGVVVAAPAIQQAREASRREECKNGLKHIGLAFHNYHNMDKVLPGLEIPNVNAPPSIPLDDAR